MTVVWSHPWYRWVRLDSAALMGSPGIAKGGAVEPRCITSPLLIAGIIIVWSATVYDSVADWYWYHNRMIGRSLWSCDPLE